MLISSWCDLKPSKQLFNCENWFGSHIALRHMWSNLQKHSREFNQTKNKFCWSKFVTTWNILRDESHQFFCLVIFHWLFSLTLTIYFGSEFSDISIQILLDEEVHTVSYLLNIFDVKSRVKMYNCHYLGSMSGIPLARRSLEVWGMAITSRWALFLSPLSCA